MKIEKSPNHSHFFTQDRVVYEVLTTGETNKIRSLDFYYPNWETLSDQAVIYLNTHHEHHPEYKAENIPEPKPQKVQKPVQIELFSI